MPVFRPRNRLVNFRLSEDEFEKVRASCSLHGARSLSDFARSAVLRSVANGPSAGETLESSGAPVEARMLQDSKVNQLDRKVGELESRISELLSLVRSLEQFPDRKSSTPDVEETRSEFNFAGVR
jgi:hypothetical protein